MIKEVFLACALALPAQSDKMAKLHAFIEMYKDYQIHLSDDKHPPNGKGWELSKIKWEGMALWVRKSA